MRSAYIAIGYMCNHECKICPCGNSQKKSSEPSIEKCMNVVSRILRDKDISHVTISGGEPTLQKSFLSVLQAITDKKIYITLLTNSESFNNDKLLKSTLKIIDKSKFNITTALHGHTKAIHDYVTSKAGSFDRTWVALNKIIETGINLTIKCILTKQNYYYLSNYLEFIYDKFPLSVSLHICGMDYCGINDKQINDFKLNILEDDKPLRNALSKIENYDKVGKQRRVFITDIPLCNIPAEYWNYVITRNRNGTTSYTDPDYIESNYIQHSFINNCDTFFRSCEQCDVQMYCPGSWKSSYELFSESMVNPIKIKCSE